MCLRCKNGVPFVLFADDDADTLEMLTFYAKSLGWRYDTARTGEEMLKKINERCGVAHECFDLVVGDLFYRAPGAMLDGLSALREIRKRS
jgi:CheY-like chemotaxis protein